MTSMLHDFGDVFDRKLMNSELEYFTGTDAGLRVLAEQYVGLPYEEVV
jgi:p-hydroxybenzoate 3-monooxygenase